MQGPAQEPQPTTNGDPQAPAQEAPALSSTSLGSANVSEVEKELETALAKANENYDLYLRAKAEAENIRRRAQDDIGKAHKFAIESFAEALVPVMDSLEKALEVQGATVDPVRVDSLREGVQITLKQLQAAFDKGRLAAINPVGEKFDPHKHQAISMVPAPEGVAPNHVVSVLQKGWMLSDRVLRPALVTVAQP